MADTTQQLHAMGAIPGNAQFQAFVCPACGSEFQTSPRMARFLAGGKGTGATGLCWVCAHLDAAVQAFAARLRKQMEPYDQIGD